MKKTKIEVQFFCNENLSPKYFENSNLYFVNFKNIYPYLYSLFYSENRDFEFFPSVEIESQPLSNFELLLKQTETVIICVFNNTAWILITPSDSQFAFRHHFLSKFIIVKAKVDDFISNLIRLNIAKSQLDLWTENNYNFGLDLLNVSIFRNVTLPESKNIFILSSEKTLIGFHLNKLAMNTSNVTRNILDADLILIQQSHLAFLHRLPHFYDILKTNVKFLLQKNLEFQEILLKGGFVTLSPELIEKFELLEISDLLEIILRKPNWQFRVSSNLYNILKKRLSNQSTLPEFLPKVKFLYKTFKDNIIECSESNLIAYLEKNNFMTHRHFIEVVMIKTNEYSYFINEAKKIIFSN